MADERMHNDCEGGACAACAWDELQTKMADRDRDLEVLRELGLSEIAKELETLRKMQSEMFAVFAASGAAT